MTSVIEPCTNYAIISKSHFHYRQHDPNYVQMQQLLENGLLFWIFNLRHITVKKKKKKVMHAAGSLGALCAHFQHSGTHKMKTLRYNCMHFSTTSLSS